MKKISVIVTVYNCEEYIEECLKSVENQTMNEKNYEVIIINDGSKDDSMKIIKKFSAKNRNWKIIDRENKGVAISRNEGISLSTAEYIIFLDSDDYLLDDALENMYKEITFNNADIGIFRTRRFDSKKIKDDSYIDKFESFSKLINLSIEPRLASFIRNVGIIYNRNIIKEIKFIPNTVHEDNYFCVSAYNQAKKIYISNLYVYMIRDREGNNLSIMQKQNYKSFKDLYLNIKKADLEIKNKDVIKIHINQLYAYIIKYVDRNNKENSFKIIKEYLSLLYKEGIINLKEVLYYDFYICVKRIFHRV